MRSSSNVSPSDLGEADRLGMQSRTRTYIAEIRAFNCLMAAFAALIGVFVSKVPLAYDVIAPAFWRSSQWFLVTAGGNVINDCFDVDIDRVNKPRRALPVGSSRGAVRSYTRSRSCFSA